jgi:hypothetical protein
VVGVGPKHSPDTSVFQREPSHHLARGHDPDADSSRDNRFRVNPLTGSSAMCVCRPVTSNSSTQWTSENPTRPPLRLSGRAMPNLSNPQRLSLHDWGPSHNRREPNPLRSFFFNWPRSMHLRRFNMSWSRRCGSPLIPSLMRCGRRSTGDSPPDDCRR